MQVAEIRTIRKRTIQKHFIRTSITKDVREGKNQQRKKKFPLSWSRKPPLENIQNVKTTRRAEYLHKLASVPALCEKTSPLKMHRNRKCTKSKNTRRAEYLQRLVSHLSRKRRVRSDATQTLPADTETVVKRFIHTCTKISTNEGKLNHLRFFVSSSQ